MHTLTQKEWAYKGGQHNNRYIQNMMADSSDVNKSLTMDVDSKHTTGIKKKLQNSSEMANSVFFPPKSYI